MYEYKHQIVAYSVSVTAAEDDDDAEDEAVIKLPDLSCSIYTHAALKQRVLIYNHSVS